MSGRAQDPRAYDVVVGTGGLGTGIMLALEGDHTLGREESRAVHVLAQRDRCKLQIIAHHVARLGPVDVVAVGRVGDDGHGVDVISELVDEGMDASRVSIDRQLPTLTSYCFTYPNGDGGNLTTTDSASARLTPEHVAAAEPVLAEHGDRAIALAAPEVPMAARRALLEAAGRHGALRFASFLSGEIEEAYLTGLLELVDVLAINIDEAAAVAGLHGHEEMATESVVRLATRRLREQFPALALCITAGSRGSWVVVGDAVHHEPALRVEPVNAAGAGDAHLGALIAATAAGLDLREANRFATTVSAQSVLSTDTINPEITPATVRAFAAAHGREIPRALADGWQDLASARGSRE